MLNHHISQHSINLLGSRFWVASYLHAKCNVKHIVKFLNIQQLDWQGSKHFLRFVLSQRKRPKFNFSQIYLKIQIRNYQIGAH